MIKERPIIFNTDMVKAILEGRKTMTRRPIKCKEMFTVFRYPDGRLWPTECDYNENIADNEMKCPFGKPGDMLYVRETWAKLSRIDGHKELFYAADGKKNMRVGFPCLWNWKPSIHMPKEYARIWLRITDVRVERVQDISEVDAYEEGADFCLDVDGDTFRERFMNLWNLIYGKGDYKWENNPFTWVVEFERVAE